MRTESFLSETQCVETVLTRSADEAAAFIRRGGVVAFPTETVYGLGAGVFDEAAIGAIFNAKKRPADNPLIAHVSSVELIDELVTEIPPRAERLIRAFFPGPLTLVLPKAGRVPLAATAGLETIGVRMPRLEIARKFLAACGSPVVAPSANLSGRPSPTTWEAVYEDLAGSIDCILQGDATEIGLESTVVDCTSPTPVLLRTGAVSLESLREVVPEIRQADGSSPATARSPGLRHVHYSPRARVVLTRDPKKLTPMATDAFIGITPPVSDFAVSLVCSTLEEFAASIFEFFRECDRRGVLTIYCEEVSEEGIGAALMDRIRRASAG